MYNSPRYGVRESPFFTGEIDCEPVDYFLRAVGWLSFVDSKEEFLSIN